MKSTSEVTPERIDSTQPWVAAADTSSFVSSTALGPVMQVNHFFSTMSSPKPFNRVWNRCVWVLTRPGITIASRHSTTSASGLRPQSVDRDPMAPMRSPSMRMLALSRTSRRPFTVTTQPSARMMLMGDQIRWRSAGPSVTKPKH